MSHKPDSLKSILFALAANAAIAVAKFVAAAFTGSGSMLAEGVHSLVDTSNQGLLLAGLKTARQPASDDHPLGHGKSIYFWSFVVALILFSLGGLFSIYEGLHKLESGEPLAYPLVAIAVLVFAIAAESVSLWGCLREVNKVRAERSLLRWFRETRQSELLVVLGEDVAAILGLVLAIIAVSLTAATGNPVYDALGSILIGVLLVVVALLVGSEVKDLLIGQGVEPSLHEEMLAVLRNHPAVDRIFNLRTLQLGADILVAVKAQMSERDSARRLLEDINCVEREFRTAFPEVRWLFFEPDYQD